MYLNNSILEDIRVAIGLTRDTLDFDADLIMHINNAIGKLYQNGVGNIVTVTSSKETWNDLQNPLQVKGNEYFPMVVSFITLSTKLIFDPPPPSTVDRYVNIIDETLWRLRAAYDEDLTPVIPINIEEY